MPYKGKAETHSGQGKDTIQPNSDTYMCNASAGRDRPENSAETPALSGGGGTMCESPNPPSEESVHMNPLSNLTYEHMYNPWPADPVRARDASNPVYGPDLEASNPVCGPELGASNPVYGPELGASNPVYGPDLDASNPVYGHDLKGQGTDPDTDLRPASMEPYAVRYQEEDAAEDNNEHRPASMEPYAIRYQDEDADDDNSLSHEMQAAGTSGNDADTSAPRRDDRNMGGTRKPRHAQGDRNGPREAAGGITPMQQTDFQARADAAASTPNPMYASRAGTTPMQQTDFQARADAAASVPNPMYASRADHQYPGGASGCRALCSFIRSRLTYIATGIAVLLGLVALGLVLLAFINNEEISEQTTTVDVQTTTVDALKRDQGNMTTTVDVQTTAVDASKRDHDMSTTVDALKRDQDNMSTTVDALKRDQGDMRRLSTTVDALKRDQDDMHQLTTTVDALKRDQDNMSTTVDALKRDQGDMRRLSTTVDTLKRDLAKERSRTTLEQRLDETSRTPGDHDSRNSEPFLLVGDREKEIIIQVDITAGSKVTLPLEGVGQPYALDYDPLTDCVYWSDFRNKNIKRARRDGSGMETIIDIGYPAWSLALDHAEGNIYWSVNGAGPISVAKKDGSSARTLLTSPATKGTNQLVLDPRNGLMYWRNYLTERIDRAAMDGSNPTIIIKGVDSTGPLTIDFKEDRLYYNDQWYGIYSSDLLGNDIRQVLYEHGKWVVGIAVDEDFVYWSSIWRNSSASSNQGKVGKLSKSGLTKTVLVDGLKVPDGIYLSTAAPPGVIND
uniref:Uncharacterized protein n=1 Tax=Branchiostoma floridae TaxID=7739 RepID=C3YXN9_BRAFL|eukprot:XP_002598836.1 hypothetical protein BRAFLDRAFT_74487 [Branchiostoma floridae]